MERSVIALGSISAGTRVGGMAREAGLPSAVITPAAVARTRYGSNERVPDALTAASPAPMSTPNSSAPPKTSLRGTRSARLPAGRASTNIGTNSASPIQPRSSGLPCWE